ncbi:hypothetical protein APHAL10511_001807 [Amanita phalloides]|nr:hypothetical protein APHAL10511_001807 [Amanita phalloides]
MKKTTTTCSTELVTLETSVPFAEVIGRLDSALNKEESHKIISKIRDATSRQEIENIVNDVRKGSDFVYFSELKHHQWLDIYEGKEHPATVVYTIGNPLIAQTLLKHDIRAALNVPLRLLVVENPEIPGTGLIYQRPSSVMVLTDNPGLRDAAEALDSKLEIFLTKLL